MKNRDEIAALKAEIACLRARVMMLESQRYGAQPLIYYVPTPVPTYRFQPIWGPSVTYGAGTNG